MIRTATITRGNGLNFRNGRGRMGDVTSALVSGGISAGVSLATTGISLWMNSIQLSHDADSATTAIVNGLATQLSNLDSAYLSEPNPTCADQRAALDAYDQAWAWLQSSAACGNPAYGSAGNACISDRAPGGKYPWQTYYRDPIANDPRVASLGCDTSAQILLPSITTGAYSATAITAGGGSSGTGQTATQLASAAAAAVTAAATTPASSPLATVPAAVASGIPTVYIVAGIALLGFLLFSGGSRS